MVSVLWLLTHKSRLWLLNLYLVYVLIAILSGIDFLIPISNCSALVFRKIINFRISILCHVILPAAVLGVLILTREFFL